VNVVEKDAKAQPVRRREERYGGTSRSCPLIFQRRANVVFALPVFKHRGDEFCTGINRGIFRWLLAPVKPSQSESNHFDGLTVAFWPVEPAAKQTRTASYRLVPLNIA